MKWDIRGFSSRDGPADDLHAIKPVKPFSFGEYHNHDDAAGKDNAAGIWRY